MISKIVRAVCYSRRLASLSTSLFVLALWMTGCLPVASGGQYAGVSGAGQPAPIHIQPTVSIPLTSTVALNGNMKQPTLDLGFPSATPHLPRSSATPAPPPSPTPTFLPSPTKTQTPQPPSVSVAYSEKLDIGKSVEGHPLTVTRLGTADDPILVIAGAIHGNEPNTASMVDALDNYFYDRRASLPKVNLYFLPRINPDGLNRGDRFNTNKVNLNRNFKTSNWQQDVVESASGDVRKNGGGTSPFSEPETTALAKWLVELRQSSQQPVVVIFYHAAFPPTGYVQPAYQLMYKGHESDYLSVDIARRFERALGYRYYSLWPEFTITGEAINWCGDNHLVCVDIELPDYKEPTPAQVQAHARVMLDIISRWPK